MDVYTILFIILAYSVMGVFTFITLGRYYYESYAIIKESILDTVRNFIYVKEVEVIASTFWPITWLVCFIIWLIHKSRKS